MGIPLVYFAEVVGGICFRFAHLGLWKGCGSEYNIRKGDQGPVYILERSYGDR
jgi:hypothetical protein